MGKLGKKARKFAKKNLPSVLKQRRKNKIVFKKRPSKKDTKDAVEKEVVKTAELSNGRDSEREVTVTTSLDVLFAEDDNIIVSDDSDSDGYLSEDPNCEKLSGNDNDVPLEDDRDERALSPHNQKIYEELAKQKNSLEKLKKKDKKFVKFLESYNKGEISQNQEMYSDEDETGEDLMMLDDSTTTKHKMLTCSTINLWSKLVTEEHSESALIGLLNAYRAACHLGPEETGFIDAASCPVIQDSDTFCNIYTFILSEADNIFRGLLKIPSSTCKKESILELKNTPRWKKAKPMIKSYLRSTLFLLKQVTDSEILAFSITRLRASIVFFAAFPSLLSRLIKIIVPLWATGGGTLSASSSLVIQDVVSVFGSNYFDTCFIKTYKAYIARCRSMETVDAKHIEFLRDSFVNLCSLDVEKSCKKALVSIQQLANILQHARQKDNKLPKFWLKSQNFMEQCVYSAVELLAVHFMQWSYHISFPELGTTSLIRLRKFHEKTSVESLRRVVKRLMDQVEQNVEFVQKKRDEVAFSPKDHESVDQFLQFEKGTVNSPFMQYYRSVVEKAASKMSTSSPVEPKGVKRKKIDTANGVITPFAANGNADAKRGKQKKADTANGDDNTPIAANGNVDSKGKKRKS
ncbi:nucleolar complex protein 2 homolog isoform X3 [Cynara cardunculus var. scolymus]|uniref:nucleolar complex protein 2 homolog isoform X3 n=1 Tax=Cynara cardunculus var. scolymus TaxID=59895 RepID=UPI000D629C7C|nr:nucleolar complex protein 2 homolog isoform X3 [Cynara cardunculus var. scolymus]